jgi:hypothetical protein
MMSPENHQSLAHDILLISSSSQSVLEFSHLLQASILQQSAYEMKENNNLRLIPEFMQILVVHLSSLSQSTFHSVPTFSSPLDSV